MTHFYLEKACDYLNLLSRKITDRSVGSKGNNLATDIFTDTLKRYGFVTESLKFECMDWENEGCTVRADGKEFVAYSSPYTASCNTEAKLCAISSINELKELDTAGKILLLHGDIAKEQLMPKAFPFYNPSEHQEIYLMLETCKAKAIITATGRNPELAGGMYPFPLIEDGDFNIPSVYLKEETGAELIKAVSEHGNVSVKINSRRIPAISKNVSGFKGNKRGRHIIFCAHIDSKKGTPGAIDNATGIIILMLLAERLKEYSGKNLIEITAFNGEDYYSVPGQMAYLKNYADFLNQISLVVNMDGAGYKSESSAFSMYNLTETKKETFKKIFLESGEFVEGSNWIQSDHGIFVQKGIPAIAVTSNNFMEFLSVEITHTERDNADIVDCRKLVEISSVLSKIASGSVINN